MTELKEEDVEAKEDDSDDEDPDLKTYLDQDRDHKA